MRRRKGYSPVRASTGGQRDKRADRQNPIQCRVCSTADTVMCINRLRFPDCFQRKLGIDSGSFRVLGFTVRQGTGDAGSRRNNTLISGERPPGWTWIKDWSVKYAAFFGSHWKAKLAVQKAPWILILYLSNHYFFSWSLMFDMLCEYFGSVAVIEGFLKYPSPLQSNGEKISSNCRKRKRWVRQ